MKCLVCETKKKREWMTMSALPPRIDTAEPGFWKDLKAIHNGLGLIDYEQFKRIIRYTINCGDDYAAAKWSEFHGDRLNYCLSRHPEEQGYALVNMAVQMAKIKAAKEQS